MLGMLLLGLLLDQHGVLLLGGPWALHHSATSLLQLYEHLL